MERTAALTDDGNAVLGIVTGLFLSVALFWAPLFLVLVR